MIRPLANVNLMFYHNGNKFSNQFVHELKKYPNLYDSFITMPIHTHDLREMNPSLPRAIKELLSKDSSHIPTIAISGLASLITGPKTLEWLKYAIEGEEWETTANSKDKFGSSSAPVSPDGDIVGVLLSDCQHGLCDIGPDPSSKYSRIDRALETIPAYQESGKAPRVNLDDVQHRRELETSKLVSTDERGVPLRSATAGPALPTMPSMPDVPSGAGLFGPSVPPLPSGNVLDNTRQPSSDPTDSAFERMKAERDRIGNPRCEPKMPQLPGTGIRTRGTRAENAQAQFGMPTGKGSGHQQQPHQQQPHQQQQPQYDLLPASSMDGNYGTL